MNSRRFYKSATVVSVGAGWGVELDGKAIRTPSGNTQKIPVQALAIAMAEEWNAQGDKVVPATMPLCGLTNAAIDRVGPQRNKFLDQIEEFSKSDLVCYWSDDPPSLVKRQHDAWQPLIDWVNTRFGARFMTTSGIVHIEQSDDCIALIRKEVEAYDAFTLAAFTDMATTLGSVIIALALFHVKQSAEQAFKTAYLDELYQSEKWGEDSESLDRRKALRADLDATVHFLTLLNKKDDG